MPFHMIRSKTCGSVLIPIWLVSLTPKKRVELYNSSNLSYSTVNIGEQQVLVTLQKDGGGEFFSTSRIQILGSFWES